MSALSAADPDDVSVEMSSGNSEGAAPRLKERTLSFRDQALFSEMARLERDHRESKAGHPDSGETKDAEGAVSGGAAADSHDAVEVPSATATGKAKKGELDKFLGSKSRLQWLIAGHPLTSREKLIHTHHHTEVNEDHWHRHDVGDDDDTGGVKGSFGSRNVGGRAPTNRSIYDAIESFDYTVKDTVEETLMSRILTKPDKSCKICNRSCQRQSTLWLFYVFIGAAVSLLICGILELCSWILKQRVYGAKKFLDDGDLGMAWLSWTGSSLVLCLFAVTMVLIEPAAASSGIPGLIAFLNGVQPKGGHSPLTGKETSFVSWQTMLAKTLGMIASVPSGLCIGPEGPIIHISALVAHWTCVGIQQLEQWAFPGHRFTARASEARDFLATGAACGICTAFRAPLAGVMFVVEEASSFFTTQHLEYTFLASLIAYWVTWAFNASSDGSSTVKFKQTTGDFCTYHDMVDYLFFILIGILGGVVGALFNQIVEHLNHLRVHHVNHHAGRRVFEVVTICLLTCTISVLLPSAFQCKKEVRSIMLQDSAGCLNAADTFQLTHGAVSQPFLVDFLEQANSSNCSIAAASSGSRRMLLASSSSSSAAASSSVSASIPTISEVLSSLSKYKTDASYIEGHPEQDVAWIDNTQQYIHLHYTHAHTCGKGSHQYNDMAMLWMNGGVKAVKVLLQRVFPYMLSAEVLVVFCVVYFVLAALTAGISVPAGLVVPMLLIGGSYGRLMGLGALGTKKAMCTEYATVDQDLAQENLYYWSTVARWMVRSCRMPDPGTFAIVGAASFMGGSGRITVMLATVLLELTDDASMIAPVGIVCILSMIVGNLFNHGLYHGLIPVFNIPFLNVDPPPEAKLAMCSDVCARQLVVLPKLCHINEIEDLLDRCYTADKDRDDPRACTHHAFPVVKSKKMHHLVGLITRGQLEMALVYALEHGEHTMQFVHLLKYCDRSPLTVYTTTRLSRAYIVFRKLGMRHLPVIDSDGTVYGMLTRKNLMGYLLTDQRQKELIMIKRVQRATRKFIAIRRIFVDKMFAEFTESSTAERMTIEQLKTCVRVLRVRARTSSPEDEAIMQADVDGVMREVFANPDDSGVSRAQFGKLLSKATYWKSPENRKRESVRAREAARAAMQMIEDASADDRLENNLAKMTGAHEKIRKMRRKSLSEHALSGI
jgi:chloride channel 7